MKIANIQATFPELKGKFATRSGRGEGSTAKVAISRAFADLLKSGKRKQFTTIKCTITVIDKHDICEVCETTDCEGGNVG